MARRKRCERRKGKIYSSIINGEESKIDEYRKSLSENATLESLKGTQDQWLLDDDAYVASVLRESVGDSTTVQANAADAPYTLSDLDALGQYVSALSAMEKPNNTNIYYAAVGTRYRHDGGKQLLFRKQLKVNQYHIPIYPAAEKKNRCWVACFHGRATRKFTDKEIS